MSTNRIPYGWSPDGTYHWLPGRLLAAVDGLRGSPPLALTVTERLRRQPGVAQVEASPLTGRVLVRFDERRVSHGTLLAILRAPAGAVAAVAAPAEPQWAVASLEPLGQAKPEQLLEMARQPETGAPRRRGRLQWGLPASRRGLRRLGPRAFRSARAMQRRGERVLCLLKDGRPQGLFGFRPAQAVPAAAAAQPAPEAGRPVLKLLGAATLWLTALTLPLGLALPALAVAAASAPGRSERPRPHREAPAEPEVAATVEADLPGPPPWHAMPPTRVTELLGSGEGGLATPEARSRISRAGPNALAERPKPGAGALFLQQFREPMMLILLGAAALSFGLGERIDALAIVVIVGVNALLAVGQESKTRQALEGLQRMAAATARVSRDGHVAVIPAADLVPGDIVLLEAGDAVPADLRLLDANNLSVEEAALTGESGAVVKEALALLEPRTALGDRRNMLYMGTFVRSGRARGVVVGTGMATEMGRIACLLQDAGPGLTPLQRKLNQVNRVIVVASVIISALMVGIGFLRGMSPGRVLITAISTAVAAIPEGLPITVTVAMALAVHRMSRRKAVVRHLPAVETLGSTMVICTDKTGTLTLNQMAAREIWAGGTAYTVEGPEGRFLVDGHAVEVAHDGDLAVALRMATLCSNARLVQKPGAGWTADGDPTEAAILVAAARAGLERDHLHSLHERLHEVPFDAATRSMTVVCRDQRGRLYAHVKGAPDKVLAHCTRWHREGLDEPLAAEGRAVIEQQAERMAAAGLRVLAVAYKRVDETWAPDSSEPLDQALILAGLIGLMDPPRAEVRDALARCRRAGVRVLMVTGDHPRTALAIARDLGMAGSDLPALTGTDIDRMADAELAAALAEVAVCARVAPEQKLRVVRALRSGGKVVAMTGDGVNDAPAIKEADIGIAMGQTGTEVTRATADMVLMDDNFATIVNAIEEGRGTYDNIRRTVRYTLATNIAEVVLMLGAVLAGVPLPLLPVHLLWVNLVCDGVPALSLAFDRPAAGAMERPPHRAEDGLFAGSLWRRMAVRGVALGAGTLALFGAVLGLTGNIVLARSAAMATLIASKLLYLLEVRRDEAGRRGLKPNPVLAGAIALSGLLCLAALYLPALQPIFKTTGIGPAAWGAVALVACAGVPLERWAAGRRPAPVNLACGGSLCA